MGKVLRHFMILFLLTWIGMNCWFPTEVFADRSFQVPEIKEDFGQYDHMPEPQEKTGSIQQNMQEETGTWDWITEPVSEGWKWAEEKIAAVWNWTKEKASAFWKGIEKILTLLISVVIIVGHFFKGFGKLLVDTATGIWDMLTNPVENLMSLIHAVSHPIETGKAIWQSISESWIRDVVNGDARSRAEWFGYAAGQIVLALVGTKGVDKAAKLAKGSKVAQTARRRLTDRLPAPVQKFFSKDTWRNMADYYLRGKKINWKNTLITGATGISLLGVGAFGVPKVVKFIKKIDIDCSFASHQSADSYLAAMLMPKLDCDFSYDKGGESGTSTSGKAVRAVEFEQGLEEHLIRGEGIGKGKKGVIGAHNMDEFYRTLKETGVNINDLIISKEQHPEFPGLYQIKYRLPSLMYDKSGNLVPSGQYKVISYPKTVYDPNIYSNQQIIQWGKEAMQEGIDANRIKRGVIEGYSKNGMKFAGRLNEEGKIKVFYPVF